MPAMPNWTQLCVLTVLALCQPSSQDELKLVQILFRHGDRAPTGPIPGFAKEEKPTDWPNGYGQLTTRGMNMHYNVGRYFRQRYIDQLKFVDANFNFRQTYVRSTDVDRTLMSAASQLSAWYTPATSPFNVSTLVWSPVPVHTVPKTTDRLLRTFDASSNPCARYGQIADDWDVSANYKAKLAEVLDEQACKAVGAPSSCTVAQFVDRISVLASIPDLELSGMWRVSDALLCRRQHDLAVPDWVTQDDNAAYKALRHIEDWGMYEMFDSPESRRLTGGIFIKQLLYNMHHVLKTKPNPFADNSLQEQPDGQDNLKLFLFSGHDTNVASVLEALETDHFRALAPPYASALLFETYQRPDGSIYIQLHYKNESALTAWQDDGVVLTIKGCSSSNCSLEDFTAATKAIVPKDINADCKAVSPKPASTSSPTTQGGNSSRPAHDDNLTGVILGVLLAALGVIVITYFVLRKRKSRAISYHAEALHRRLDVMEDEEDDEDVFTANVPNMPLYRSGRGSSLA
eukprot:m.71850 g.71850  ORF g.71850 m.71850 type:complete len:516 (+) comp14225_c0_seq2:44-1591(+)